MIHIGIDPGVTGAVCELNPASRTARFFDTPLVQIKSGKTMKNMLNIPACVTILRQLSALGDVKVTIEKVNPMPGMPGRSFAAANPGQMQGMGVTSAFNFGKGYGIWLGILSALSIPFEEVHPLTWKKTMMADMGKDKDASRVKAMQLYPDTAANLTLKKHHGRADALLLAEFGRRTEF
jgi:crossover junction endodeoxyribonuclease RuvC